MHAEGSLEPGEPSEYLSQDFIKQSTAYMLSNITRNVCTQSKTDLPKTSPDFLPLGGILTGSW